MSKPADHYAEADRLLLEVRDTSCVWADGSRELILLAALVNAVLATTPKEVYQQVLDAEIAQRIRESPVFGEPVERDRW